MNERELSIAFGRVASEATKQLAAETGLERIAISIVALPGDELELEEREGYITVIGTVSGRNMESRLASILLSEYTNQHLEGLGSTSNDDVLEALAELLCNDPDCPTHGLKN